MLGQDAQRAIKINFFIDTMKSTKQILFIMSEISIGSSEIRLMIK